MRTVFISPFVNQTNDYINRVKSVLQDAGYQVKPFSFRTLLSYDGLGVLSGNNMVLVHWLESRVFSEGRDGAKIRMSGLIQFLIYVVVMAMMRAKLVYFVHDHAVHDLQGWRRSLSQRLIALLGRMASLRVVHDPSYVKRYQAVYLPHPLYEDRAPAGARCATPPVAPMKAGVLGAVRPYKRIEDMIAVWPSGPTLLIRGRADAAYERFLTEAIRERGDAISVDMRTGFMSRDEFKREMGSLDALILPHADASMLVSGAFFEAIGAVPFVIARETPFTKWASTEFPSVLTFKTNEELLARIEHANQSRDHARESLIAAAEKANQFFGHAACVRLYAEALNKLEDRH